MKVAKFKSLLARLVRDEQGTEVIEYALLIGLVIIGTLVVMATLGTKVKLRWSNISSSL